MKLVAVFVCVLVSGILALGGEAVAQPGSLVIVGGGLARENAAIHLAFVERAGAGRIAIIPAASVEPSRSATTFAEVLSGYGVDPGRVDIVHVAIVDDETTPDSNEASWSRGAFDSTEVAKVERADAIWFAGGDQARLIEALYDDSGAESPLLQAVRSRLASGAVIGGTSAGAAIMSRQMIGRGDSMSALLAIGVGHDLSQSGDERLVLTDGFGFLPWGLVDQHFDTRARLGRLTRALAEAAGDWRVGVGIDENTALVIDLASRQGLVVGEGTVTVVDARRARFSRQRSRFAAAGLRLHVLTPGDAVAFGDAIAVIVGQSKRVIADGEQEYDRSPPDAVGMAMPSARLESLLGADLLDNAGARVIESASYRSDGAGFIYRFEEDDASRGYFGQDEGGRARYTISDVAFSIVPARVSIRRLQQ